MRDLIIIGGGAAGLAAAVYALDKRLDVLVIAEDPGGKAGGGQVLRGQSEPEPVAGGETVRALRREAEAHPDRLLTDRVLQLSNAGGAFQVVTERHGQLESLAVILASGAAPVPLAAHGADELLGLGLGYSATTHASHFAGKKVAVIGGTLRALRGAAELARGAARVYLIAPELLLPESLLAEALLHISNVEVLLGYQVRSINGPFNVSSLVAERAGQHRWLQVEAAFADLGLQPNSALLHGLAETDERGFVMVDRRRASTCPGLFAAGDVTNVPCEQLLIAIGDGARAAMSAYDYVLAHTRMFATSS